MPRLPKNQNTRRNDILDAAQRLIYTKGYEQMTVQDILNALGISKGAFYHYFDSKSALLEAFIERITDEALPMLIPIVEAPSLSASAKLDRFFSTTNQWKIERKALMLELLRVWQADENAIVRQKLLAMSTRRIVPLLARIIQQGVQEGSMSPAYPEYASDAVWILLQGLSENLAGAPSSSPSPWHWAWR